MSESRNTLYLVCEAHQEQVEAFRLAESAQRDRAKPGSEPNTYTVSSGDARLGKWFARHAACGPGDHFKLAYARPQNWDYSPPAPPIASAVRLALVNGSKEIAS